MSDFDVIIRGAQVVGPAEARPADIGIAGGRIEAVDPVLTGGINTIEVPADGLLAFPGVVDAHQHWGIYNDLAADVESESRACAQGGVTTSLSYIRTGQYYLNRSGPYQEVFPDVLAASEGRAFVDYGYHLAPMSYEHIGELGALVDEFGVTSFKIFMFYGSHGLHGRSDEQSAFLMIPPDERYDLAHFEFVMRGIQAVRADRPEIADQISLSLHCETAEIMTAYTRIVEARGELTGLPAYSASRPPHSEGLAVTIASYLAAETQLPTINLLHLSSAKAMDAALRMAAAFPTVDFRREVTIGHLTLDCDSAKSIAGKVNPPLRGRDDVDALWTHVLAGDVSWISSDHACCPDDRKFGADRDDVFAGYSGFGGTEYLLPVLITEGRKRGLPLTEMAKLVSSNPADRFGLGQRKGRIEVGYDADIALVDPDAEWVIEAPASLSSQGYTPFEGLRLGARVKHTFLRGVQVLDDGVVVGSPRGQYLRRPVGTSA